MNNLKGRVAVVTGASRGIGREVAKSLALQGASVVAIARTQGGLEELDDEITQAGGHVVLVPGNLQKMDNIDAIAMGIYERFKRVDIVVGNAGTLGIISPLPHIDPPVWKECIDLNLTVNYRLIRAFDAPLRQSDAGRFIFVSSAAAQKCRPYWSAYAASKAGLEAMVSSYAKEIQKTNIRVNIVHPQPIATQLRHQAYPGEDQSTLPQPHEITDIFLKLASPDFQKNGKIFEI